MTPATPKVTFLHLLLVQGSDKHVADYNDSRHANNDAEVRIIRPVEPSCEDRPHSKIETELSHALNYLIYF